VAWIAGGVLVALAVVGLSLSAFASISVADYLLGTMPLYRLGEFVLGMCLATVMKRGWRPRFRLVQAVGLSAISMVGLTMVSLIFMGTTGGLPVIYANLVGSSRFVVNTSPLR